MIFIHVLVNIFRVKTNILKHYSQILFNNMKRKTKRQRRRGRTRKRYLRKKYGGKTVDATVYSVDGNSSDKVSQAGAVATAQAMNNMISP